MFKFIKITINNIQLKLKLDIFKVWIWIQTDYLNGVSFVQGLLKSWKESKLAYRYICHNNLTSSWLLDFIFFW